MKLITIKTFSSSLFSFLFLILFSLMPLSFVLYSLSLTHSLTFFVAHVSHSFMLPTPSANLHSSFLIPRSQVHTFFLSLIIFAFSKCIIFLVVHFCFLLMYYFSCSFLLSLNVYICVVLTMLFIHYVMICSMFWFCTYML